jgi:hypothetical protein
VLKKRGFPESIDAQHRSVVALSCCSTVALVEPAGRYPCCLRSPPVAGRRPLGVSRERRYHRPIQPRTHVCRYGERHHRPGRRGRDVALVLFVPEGADGDIPGRPSRSH